MRVDLIVGILVLVVDLEIISDEDVGVCDELSAVLDEFFPWQVVDASVDGFVNVVPGQCRFGLKLLRFAECVYHLHLIRPDVREGVIQHVLKRMRLVVV